MQGRKHASPCAVGQSVPGRKVPLTLWKIIRFKEISEAYEVLSDKQKKAFYDQYGENDLKTSMNGSPDGQPQVRLCMSSLVRKEEKNTYQRGHKLIQMHAFFARNVAVYACLRIFLYIFAHNCLFLLILCEAGFFCTAHMIPLFVCPLRKSSYRTCVAGSTAIQ
jgi:hypothetical protein